MLSRPASDSGKPSWIACFACHGAGPEFPALVILAENIITASPLGGWSDHSTIKKFEWTFDNAAFLDGRATESSHGASRGPGHNNVTPGWGRKNSAGEKFLRPFRGFRAFTTSQGLRLGLLSSPSGLGRSALS